MEIPWEAMGGKRLRVSPVTAGGAGARRRSEGPEAARQRPVHGRVRRGVGGLRASAVLLPIPLCATITAQMRLARTYSTVLSTFQECGFSSHVAHSLLHSEHSDADMCSIAAKSTCSSGILMKLRLSQVPASLEEQWRGLVEHLEAHPHERPRNMPLQ